MNSVKINAKGYYRCLQPLLQSLPLVVVLLLSGSLWANNLKISNISLATQNTTDNFYLVQFDLSWDNSWRNIAPANNHDAAWLFIKYKVSGGVWQHASLHVGGHSAPSGSTIDTAPDGKGVFIYRNATGFGTNTWTGVQLRWDYGTDNVSDNIPVEVCVTGIEMVHVKEGDFAVGSDIDTTRFGAFVLTTINTANPTTAPTGTGGFSNSAQGGYPSGQKAPENNNIKWPNGYSAYYCMKYEVSQEQYKSFLNLLTYDQQEARTISSPASPEGINVMKNIFRNGIVIQTPGIASTTPAFYANNFSENMPYNAKDDGQNIVCNWLSWADGAAYGDWSGLRPMTELEFEKACRGTVKPVKKEFAWGSTNVHASLYTISNHGRANEKVNAGTNTGNASYVNTIPFIGESMNILRTGTFAGSLTSPTREEAGGSFWGIMELSGGLLERTVTISNVAGRSFTGIHGDGTLASSGDANVTSWPGSDGIGSGYRGGCWAFTGSAMEVSNRMLGLLSSSCSRLSFTGWRGVRSAP